MTARTNVCDRDLLRPDKRLVAVEPCDACGHRTFCRRWFCDECGIVLSTCGPCDRETGGQAIRWQIQAHVKRAHTSGGQPRLRVVNRD